MRHRVSLNDSVILVEYNRDITAQKYGAKLPAALRKDRSRPTFDPQLSIAFQRVQNQLKQVPADYFPDKLSDDLRADIISTVLSALETRDPSATKEYTPWLAKVYGEGTVPFEDVNRQDLLTKFDTLKRKKKLKPEHRDIMRFRTYREFEDAVHSYPDEDTQSDDRGAHERLYDGPDARIIKPTDQTAACFWGRGTRWCTAGRENNQFDRYHSDGPIYILIPKEAQTTGEKYQLWFATDLSSFECRDAQDDWFSPQTLKERYPQAIDFLVKHEPLTQNVVAFASKHVVDTVMRYVVGAAQAIADYNIRKFVDRYDDGEFDIDEYVERMRSAVFNALMADYHALVDWSSDDAEDGATTLTSLPQFYASRISYRGSQGDADDEVVNGQIRYDWEKMRVVLRGGQWRVVTSVPINEHRTTSLVEALDSPLKWQWTKQSADYHAAEFALPDGTLYIFEFRTVPFAPPDVWTIAFQPKGAEDWDQQYGALNVGVGVATKVLATAVQILQDFGRTKQPAEIIFGANANERGRIRLYQRLIQQFVPTVPQYEALPMRNYGDDQKVFVVRHKEREGSRMFDGMFEASLNEMPLPADWDDTLRTPKASFAKRIAYAKEKAKRLASGSSRVAFVMPYEGRDTVLKIAKNAKGLAQNEYEASILSDHYAKDLGILIPMIDHDTNEPPSWLHVEKADRKTNDADFRRVCGGTPADLCAYVGKHLGKRLWGGNPDVIDSDSEFVSDFMNLVGNYDMPIADFTRHANWGMWKGKPVIIDVGLSTDVQQKYYSPRQQVASFARRFNQRHR